MRDELIELRQLLEIWNQRISTLNADSADSSSIAEQAQSWSDRILKRSGLLSEQGLPASII